MRYQRGQSVLIGSQQTGHADAPPVAAILDPNAEAFATVLLPYAPVRGTDYTYATLFQLPGGAALGTYTVTITYAIDGTPWTDTSTFDVVAGGDSGGSVISLYAYDRPEARFVLAQLSSGKLVQGRNPHL